MFDESDAGTKEIKTLESAIDPRYYKGCITTNEWRVFKFVCLVYVLILVNFVMVILAFLLFMLTCAPVLRRGYSTLDTGAHDTGGHANIRVKNAVISPIAIANHFTCW